MSKTGFVRRVDLLGRVVIPREVRLSLGINSGDTMVFNLLENRTVVMKKFSSLLDNIQPIMSVVEVLSQLTRSAIYVFDTDKLICENGQKKDKDLTPVFKKVIYKHTECRVNQIEIAPNTSVSGNFSPIIVNGDLLGGIIVNSESEKIRKTIQDFFQNYFS